MTSVRQQQRRAAIASLLAIILMAVSTLLSANLSANTMALPLGTDSAMSSTAITPCHQGAEPQESEHPMAPMQDCAGGDSCQCITLCQITAASDAPFHGDTFLSATPATATLISAIHAGIHRLPLRPPSLFI
ncbi:hypothetical protein [Alcanivorax sp.]|jgi:hypothetical protein|uniref:hypothetical protein n=1 Tax=Alcanivorax sp. TaxID=1872427 RepID=UPI0032D98EC8